MQASDIEEIVRRTVREGEIVERLLFQDEYGVRLKALREIPIYRRQHRLLLDANTRIDLRSLDDYLAVGGYSALGKVLDTMSPKQVVELVKKSGLRGRGGGGFPTGRKWESTREAPGEPKYVPVNGDEGNPGVYMDRSLLEGNPHRVLEGLLIGAYAIGARHGYVYVRQARAT